MSGDISCDLPDVDFCLNNPIFKLGQIRKIHIGVAGIPLSSAEGIGEIKSRNLLLKSDPDAIRTLSGIGQKPKPSVTKTWGSLQRNIVINKEHAITFKVDEMSRGNDLALMDFNRAGHNFVIWYETADELLFGGEDGIPVSIDSNRIIPESKNDISYWELDILWKIPTPM